VSAAPGASGSGSLKVETSNSFTQAITINAKSPSQVDVVTLGLGTLVSPYGTKPATNYEWPVQKFTKVHGTSDYTATQAWLQETDAQGGYQGASRINVLSHAHREL